MILKHQNSIYVNDAKKHILRNDFRIPTPPKKIIYQGRGDTNIYIYIYSENMEYSTDTGLWPFCQQIWSIAIAFRGE